MESLSCFCNTFICRKTADLCKKVETAGVSWIAVHGRTREQRSDPVNYEAIKLVKENVTIPVIANGDVCDVEDITKVCDLTGVNGKFFRHRRLLKIF